MKRLLPVLLLLIVGCIPVASSAAIAPKQAVAHAKAAWLAEIRPAAQRGDRSARFPSPSRSVLLRRLHKAEKLYGFRIVSVQMLQPRQRASVNVMLRPLQSAPVIVISSNHKQAIAKATPKIIALFDPRHPMRMNPSGYAYEAYLLVAQTSRGVPFLATFNHRRAPHVGGGQWAESDNLYPFPHG